MSSFSSNFSAQALMGDGAPQGGRDQAHGSQYSGKQYSIYIYKEVRASCVKNEHTRQIVILTVISHEGFFDHFANKSAFRFHDFENKSYLGFMIMQAKFYVQSHLVHLVSSGLKK